MTGKQLDEVGLAGKIPGIPGPEFRLAWVMPQAGGLMGSGKWRHPQVRVAATGPLGCKPFLPLDDGEKWTLECGESVGCSPSPDYRFLSRSLLHLCLLALSLHPSSDSQDFPKALPVPLFRVGSMCMWGVTLPETFAHFERRGWTRKMCSPKEKRC